MLKVVCVHEFLQKAFSLINVSQGFDDKPRTGFCETLIFVEHLSLTVPLNFEKAALHLRL